MLPEKSLGTWVGWYLAIGFQIQPQTQEFSEQTNRQVPTSSSSARHSAEIPAWKAFSWACAAWPRHCSNLVHLVMSLHSFTKSQENHELKTMLWSTYSQVILLWRLRVWCICGEWRHWGDSVCWAWVDRGWWRTQNARIGFEQLLLEDSCTKHVHVAAPVHMNIIWTCQFICCSIRYIETAGCTMLTSLPTRVLQPGSIKMLWHQFCHERPAVQVSHLIFLWYDGKSCLSSEWLLLYDIPFSIAKVHTLLAAIQGTLVKVAQI